MNRLKSPKITLLALGNRIRSDDAVGLFALRQIEHDPQLPSFVNLVEGGTKGLELIPYVCEASCLLVLDAVDVGALPGTVFHLAGDELRSLPGNGNVHELALADLLNALRMMGREPAEIVLLGVQPLTTELGTELSVPVLAALPTFVQTVLNEICRRAEESSVPAAAASELDSAFSMLQKGGERFSRRGV
jgi:hydrogenase maturation protease